MLEFITIAKQADLPPGERIVVEIGRRWIVVFNVEGQFYAVDDDCTHEEFPLSEGALNGYSLECAKHGAQFDIRDGKVLAPPAFVAVKTYEVRVENDEIQLAVRR